MEKDFAITLHTSQHMTQIRKYAYFAILIQDHSPKTQFEPSVRTQETKFAMKLRSGKKYPGRGRRIKHNDALRVTRKLRSKGLRPHHSRLRLRSVRGLAKVDSSSRRRQTVDDTNWDRSTSSSEATGIQALPPEILREIFKSANCKRRVPIHDFTCYHSSFNIILSPTPAEPNEDHPPYKSFRQVCRVWHNVATPLLFHTLTLLFHVDSWANLDNICIRPHLGQHVRVIQLDTSKPIPLCDLNEWQAYIDGEFEPPRYGHWRPWSGPLAMEHQDHHKAYSRYVYWSNGEQVMNGYWAAGFAPRLQLHRLPDLRRIETIGLKDLVVVKTLSRDVLAHRRRVEVSNHLPMFSKACNSLQMDPITLSLRDGSELISMHGVPLRSLRDGSQLIIMHTAMPLRWLRRLELDLVVDDGYCGCYPFLEFDKAPHASWVHGFESLEELSVIVAPDCNDYRSTFTLFSRMMLPRLRIVYLKRVRMLYIWLDTFLQAHRDTIRNLRIEEPRMALEDWMKFRLQEQKCEWNAANKVLQLSEACLHWYIEEPKLAVKAEWLGFRSPVIYRNQSKEMYSSSIHVL